MPIACNSKLTCSGPVASNPHHGLKGLEDFSHVWVRFSMMHQGLISWQCQSARARSTAWYFDDWVCILCSCFTCQLVFLFDGNGTSYTPRPNVYPPRLLGKSKGVFATRSPHRPNPIGLSLCKIEAIEGRTLVMSGVDLVDGTPIIDVKPYIPCYDAPFANGEDGSADWGVEWAAR
jgi:tRNA-Thr(GGU) m(6)t(6)A37 methyltransferase TsaA